MFLPDGVYSLASVSVKALYFLFFHFHNGKKSPLQTSGVRAVFWAFNDSSRARLYLDLAKDVDDVSPAVEIERRS